MNGTEALTLADIDEIAQSLWVHSTLTVFEYPSPEMAARLLDAARLGLAAQQGDDPLHVAAREYAAAWSDYRTTNRAYVAKASRDNLYAMTEAMGTMQRLSHAVLAAARADEVAAERATDGTS